MRRVVVLLVTIWLAGGCRHAESVRPEPAVAPTVIDRAAAFPPIEPVAYNPDRHALPDADPGTKRLKELDRNLTFLGVIEPEAQCLAAKTNGVANALDREVPGSAGHGHKRNIDVSAELRRQLRTSTALELRNRSAADALERYFQLADAEARSELLREALPVLDSLRDLATKAKAASFRYPLEPDEADRQRSQVLAQLEQAEAGVGMLNVDLRRRFGMAWSGSERLWPTGDFGVVAERIDVEAAVQGALANRPELQGLRALEAGMTTETLPIVRDALRAANPLLAASPVDLLTMSPLHRMIATICRDAGDEEAELAQRKAQVADLRAERERAVADEARAAAMQLNAQVPRIALAIGRADSWKAKLAEARKSREANIVGSDLLESQAMLESLKARSEVVTEVMAWHQSRVRLKAAQGLLAWECAPPR